MTAPIVRKPCVYNATITRREDLAEGLSVFRVRPDTPIEKFLPGQYLVVGINHPERGSVLRSYSIASAPFEHEDGFDFYIRYVYKPTSETPFTHMIFDMKVGDRLHLGPKARGHFTLHYCCGTDDDPRLKLLVAAGTGLAPFTSMVREHFHAHGWSDRFAILHGASHDYELGYRGELEAAMNSHGCARYVPTISRPQNCPAWKGMTGRVESLLEPARLPDLERTLGLEAGFINPGNCVILVCGLTGTIANAISSAMERGFVPEDRKLRHAFRVPEALKPSVFFEAYDTEPVMNIADPAVVARHVGMLERNGVALTPAASHEP